MAPTTTNKVSNQSKDLGTSVLMPNVGRVTLHAGHLSFIRDVTGSAFSDFGSLKDLRSLIASAKTVCLKRRLGSETQAFAFFLRLGDIANGCIQVESPDYQVFAKVWEEYCDMRFRVKGEKTLTPYGKSVSRGIFVGKPEKDKQWRDAVTVFPLHTSPCDVCLFLTSIVKTSSGSDSPYGLLDMKGIHDFFASRFDSKILGPMEGVETVTSVEEPSYDPQSPAPQVEIASDSEDDLPLSTFVTPKSSRPSDNISQKDKHRVGKRSFGRVCVTQLAQQRQAPSQSKQATSGAGSRQLVDVYVPGEIEW